MSGNPRLAAVRALVEVCARGRSLAEVLPRADIDLPPADRAFCRELIHGVLRRRRRLEAIAGELLARPLKRRDSDVLMALLAGLYQLTELRTPDHAAVSETVALARALRKVWAAKLLNATLRRFLRERDTLVQRVDIDPAVRHSLPDWLARRLRTERGDEWPRIAEALGERPPMTLRVNRRRATRDVYSRRLADAGIEAAPVVGLPEALRLVAPVPVDRLPGFAEGDVSVQDGAAQWAAMLLDPPPGSRVLDACAAPGNKTAHLLERGDGLLLTAVDVDEARTQRLHENLERLGLACEAISADVADTASWWDGAPFERILLDAPCSGTGVIRRHPDIRWLRRDSDIGELATLQGRLLAALWPTLRRGGTLLYATCSVLRAENADVVEAFLRVTPDAEAVPVAIDSGRADGPGRQLMPGDDGMDGFFYACLVKR